MKPKAIVAALLFTTMIVCSCCVHAQTVSQACQPGISFWSLLGAGIGYQDGTLNVNKLYAVCLPTPAKPSGSNFPYDPDAGGKLTMTVKTAGGKPLNTYVWYAENFSGLWEMSRYKIVGGYEAVKPLGAGDFVLEFAIEERPFYRFPFSVSQVKSDDPYQPPGTRYFIEGPWNEYGNLFYQRNDPQSSLRFSTWVQEKTGKDAKRSVPYKVELTRLKDGKILAEDAATLRLEPRWRQADFSLQPTSGEKNTYFKAGELLREDGLYRVRLMIDSQLYGDYPFEVKGGRIQFQGKQIREKTDPMNYLVDYLYGGRYTSWWIQRQGVVK